MKKIVFFVLLCNIFACSKQNYSPYSYSNEETIYSSSEKVKFREVLFTIKPYLMVDNQKKYILSDSIKNIVVKINNQAWAIVHSFALDTSSFIKESNTNWLISNQISKYSVLAPYQPAKAVLTTAGEYADLLSNFFILETGTYFCQIESFEIRQKNGQMKKINPQIVIPLEVKENVRNAWIGDFEVLIQK